MEVPNLPSMTPYFSLIRAFSRLFAVRVQRQESGTCTFVEGPKRILFAYSRLLTCVACTASLETCSLRSIVYEKRVCSALMRDVGLDW